MVLDSDATLLKHMDELFFISSCKAATPRAYWLDNPYMSSQVMLIEPSTTEFQRVQKAINQAKDGTFDMEIVNQLYGSECLVLPHEKYDLLTGEFRSTNHRKFFGKDHVKWNPAAIFNQASYIHFSDYPFPKPWYKATQKQVEASQPACEYDDGSTDDCYAKYIWLDLYKDFENRRMVSV